MTFQPVKDPVAVVELETPIQFMGEKVTSIALRKPTTADIFNVGNPVLNFDWSTGAYVFDEKKALRMVFRLSGIPIEGSLEQMDAEDAIACFEELGPFFVKGLRKTLEAYRAAKAKGEASSPKPDEPPAS